MLDIQPRNDRVQRDCGLVWGAIGHGDSATLLLLGTIPIAENHTADQGSDNRVWHIAELSRIRLNRMGQTEGHLRWINVVTRRQALMGILCRLDLSFAAPIPA